MRGYYAGKLSGERLRRCYEIASPRVQQYLEAEIRFVRDRLGADELALELGCGYGRVALRLAAGPRCVVGIDTSADSLALGRRLAGPGSRCRFAQMDALQLAFRDSQFDRVACVQNGICAFGVDPEALLREAVRVTRPGGSVLFSTYAERFWPDRLAWFEAQAALGLVGPIDHERTESGTIVCTDGFRARMLSPAELRRLGEELGLKPQVTEVDGSSVFCEILVPAIP